MSSFQFERVDLGAFRGFSGMGFKVDRLGAGIIVIHGPNGAGKSSLVQAMELLLWEQNKAPEGTWLRGQVRLGGQSQERERLQDRLVTRVGGQPAPSSPWAGPATRDRYRLALSDLLQAREANQAFSEQLRQEMQGGVDFPKHRAEVGALSAFSRKAGASAAFEEACAAVDRQSRAQGELAALEEEIRQHRALAGTLEGQQKVERRLSGLDEAMGTLEALLACDAALVPFRDREAVLAGLGEADDTRFQALRQARDEARATVAGLRIQLAALEGRLVPLDLPGPPGEADAEAARNLAKALQDAEKAAQDQARAHAGALAALAEWRQANPWLCAPGGQLAALSEETLDRARTLARKFEQCQSLVHALNQLALELGPEELPPPREALAAATLILEQWQDRRAILDAQSLPAPKGRWGALSWLLLGAGLLAGAAATFLARGASPLGPAAVAASVLLLVLGAFGLRPAGLREDPERLKRGLEALQGQFNALGIPGLAGAWTAPEVVVLARRLREAAASAAGVVKLNETRRRAGSRLASETAAWKRLLDEAGDLARQLGLPPEVAAPFGGCLEILGRRLQEGQALSAAQATAGALNDHAAVRLGGLQDHAATLLRTFGRRADADPVAGLTVLARDLDTALRLRAERAALEKELERAASQSPQAALDAFLAERRLAEHTFQEAWDTRQRWRPLLAAYAGQRNLAEALFQRETHWTPGIQAIADRRSPLPERQESLAQARAELQAQLAAARLALSRINEARDAAQAKQAQVERLTREGTLAALILARDQAAQKLEEQRVKDLEGRALARLIDRLETRGADEDLKPQLRRASDLFQDFTGQRYTLRFEQAAFVAREGRQTLRLDQLSEGTRLQLLMAVRLAYVEHQEGPDGPRLPLFLDEVLANSDDTRAQAIIEAIRAMARGRQIFYFTAQQDEVAKFRHLAADLQVIDLAEVRGLEARALSPLPGQDRLRPPVPDPGADSLLAYARRLPGAAGPALWTSLSRQHAWLAFAEGEQAGLHALLQGGLSTIGQVRNYLETQSGPDAQRRLVTIAILEEAQAQLQAARPRPITPADLEGAGIKGFGDMANVLAALAECGNDPQDLLKRPIAGVGTARKESLREWLKKGGYLVEAETSAEAILAGLRGRYSSLLELDAKGWLAVERFLERA